MSHTQKSQKFCFIFYFTSSRIFFSFLCVLLDVGYICSPKCRVIFKMAEMENICFSRFTKIARNVKKSAAVFDGNAELFKLFMHRNAGCFVMLYNLYIIYAICIHNWTRASIIKLFIFSLQ